MAREISRSGFEDLELSHQLCFALYATTHAITKRYRSLLVALDLTYPQYLVMLVLWQNQPVTVAEIGDYLSLDSGTLTPMLKRMQSNGMIVRERGTEDERQVHIKLTQKGKNLRSKAIEVNKKVACATQYTPVERNKMIQSLLHLRNSLASTEEQ